jgi:hypothetical protein
VKPALHAECENQWASSSAPVAGGSGLVLAVGCIVWSYSKYVGLVGVAVAAGVLLVAFVIGLVYHLRHGPGVVVAGDDGVEVRWGRKPLFIRYCDLDRVLTDGARFRLVRSSGPVVAVRLRGLAPRTDVRDTAIVKRITRRVGDPKLNTPLVAAEPFARGALEAAAWLEAMAARLPTDGAYRGPAIDRNQLVRIIQRGRSAPTARAACAWLLRASGFEEGDEQIVRDAARATASVALAETLTAIATATASADEIAELMARVPATR